MSDWCENDSGALVISLRGQTWSHSFKIDGMNPRWMMFPEVYGSRVFINFMMKRDSRVFVSWDMAHIIQETEAFDFVYGWLQSVFADGSVHRLYDPQYTDAVIDVVNGLQVELEDLLPPGTIVYWTDADKACRDGNCDAARIIQTTNKKKIFKPHRKTAAIYKIQNLCYRPLDGSVSPPTELQRVKWVNDSDIVPLSIRNRTEYPWTALRYWRHKAQEIQQELDNYIALDESNVCALLNILSVRIQNLLDDKYVGKSKKTVNKDLPSNFKHCVMKYIENELGVSDWKKRANIYSLCLSDEIHTALFGNPYKECYSYLFEEPVLVHTIRFEESNLKISVVDDDKMSLYATVHVVRVMPNGCVVGQKHSDDVSDDEEHKNDM